MAFKLKEPDTQPFAPQDSPSAHAIVGRLGIVSIVRCKSTMVHNYIHVSKFIY